MSKKSPQQKKTSLIYKNPSSTKNNSTLEFDKIPSTENIYFPLHSNRKNSTKKQNHQKTIPPEFDIGAL